MALYCEVAFLKGEPSRLSSWPHFHGRIFCCHRSTNVKPHATNNNCGLAFFNDQIFNIAQVTRSLVRPCCRFVFIDLIIFMLSFVHRVKIIQVSNGPMMHPFFLMLGCNTLVSSNVMKEKMKIKLHVTMVSIYIHTCLHKNLGHLYKLTSLHVSL